MIEERAKNKEEQRRKWQRNEGTQGRKEPRKRYDYYSVIIQWVFAHLTQ